MTRNTWLATAGAALLVLGVVGGLALGSKVTTPQQAAAQAEPPEQGPVAVSLEERSLTLGVTARGSVVPGSGLDVLPPGAALEDAAVVTEVDIRTGDIVDDGRLLMDISGQPLVSAALPFPLYRDLSFGDTGPDVDALNDFLDRQDARSSANSTVDGNFATGVRQLLQRWGYNHLAASVPAPSPTAATTGTAANPTTAQPAPSTTPVFARRWMVPIDRSGRHVTSLNVTVGSVLAADKSMMTLDATAPTVRGYLDSEATQHVTTGTPALAVDDASSRQIQLQVTGVDTTDTTDPTTGAPGRAVTLSASDPGQLVGITGSLTLNLTVPLSDRPELVVPVAAIRTTAAGDSSVTVLHDNKAQTQVPVTVGTCSDGWCQLSSGTAQLHKGDLVIVSDTGSR